MDKLTFKLEQFEGPLDLLLHLISKHKLNLYDIEIDALLEQYLDYMQKAAADLDVASEFLEMASRLVYMKSAQLLPKYEDEGEELKRELTGQLLEYQACKEAAALLAARFCGDSILTRPPGEMEIDHTYQRVHEPGEILGAYLAVLGKIKRKMPPPKEAFSGIVKRRVVSVQSQIVRIFNLLYRQKKVDLRRFFAQSEDRSEMVAAFLAVLELVRAKRVRVLAGDEIVFGEVTAPLDEPDGDYTYDINEGALV